MTRFYVALFLLLLMGAHESIVAALGASVVGFSLPPIAVFALVALSPFLLLLANGLPSLMEFLPTTGSGPALTSLTVNAHSSPFDRTALAALSEAVFAGMTQAAAANRPMVLPPVVSPAPMGTVGTLPSPQFTPAAA